MIGLVLVAAGTVALHAQPVLIQAPASSALEYQARLKADPQLLSPVQAYIKQHPARPPRVRLLEGFAEAQKAFLENTPAYAFRLFEALVTLQNEDDWSVTEREVFLTAYLRLAQLDIKREEHWLRQALSLSPELEADAELFPPPLLEHLQELKSKLPSVNPANALRSGEWTAILINGFMCTRTQCREWPDVKEKMRVTFLSEKWVTQTLFLTPSAIAKTRPGRVPWVSGECGSPVYHPRAGELGGINRAFFGLQCDSGPRVNLQPPLRSAELQWPVIPPDKPKRFYKSPWFWAGIGVLTAVLVAQSKNRTAKSEPRPEPVTTYGN